MFAARQLVCVQNSAPVQIFAEVWGEHTMKLNSGTLNSPFFCFLTFWTEKYCHFDGDTVPQIN